MKKTELTTGGWVRLSLYVVTVLTGLVSYIAGQLGYEQVHEVAASLGQALMILSGGTAASNLNKAPDQSGGPLGQLFDLLNKVEKRVSQGQDPAPGLPTYDGPTTAE